MLYLENNLKVASNLSHEHTIKTGPFQNIERAKIMPVTWVPNDLVDAESSVKDRTYAKVTSVQPFRVIECIYVCWLL